MHVQATFSRASGCLHACWWVAQSALAAVKSRPGSRAHLRKGRRCVQAFTSLKLTEERVDAAIDLFERVEFSRGQVRLSASSALLLLRTRVGPGGMAGWTCWELSTARQLSCWWSGANAWAQLTGSAGSTRYLAASHAPAACRWSCLQAAWCPSCTSCAGGQLQVLQPQGPNAMPEAGGFSYFGDNVLEVSLPDPLSARFMQSPCPWQPAQRGSAAAGHALAGSCGRLSARRSKCACERSTGGCLAAAAGQHVQPQEACGAPEQACLADAISAPPQRCPEPGLLRAGQPAGQGDLRGGLRLCHRAVHLQAGHADAHRQPGGHQRRAAA